MELCTSQASPTPKLYPLSKPIPIIPNRIQISPSSPRLPLTILQPHFRRFSHSVLSVPRAAVSEESSGGLEQFSVKEIDFAVAVEGPPPETSAYVESESVEVFSDEQSNDFFADFNLKFDSLDVYSILPYGAGALVVLWLASAIIGAIDSIPLFPKLMEVVGLGYSFWFAIRYLLFKQNRDELAAKIEDLKQQVFSSDD